MLQTLMQATGVPNGLSGVGYGEADLGALTKGTMVQQRLLTNSPRAVDAAAVDSHFRAALRYW